MTSCPAAEGDEVPFCPTAEGGGMTSCAAAEGDEVPFCPAAEGGG